MSAEIFMGTMMVTVTLLFFVLAIGLFVFWVWTIVDVAKRDFTNSNERLIWLLLIILLGFVPSKGRSNITILSNADQKF